MAAKKDVTPAPQHNNFVDSRYQHNHSYPLRGESVRSLPRDYRAVTHGHSRYYYSHGAWYRSYRGRYFVVTPPFGLFVPFLPLYYTTIWIQGIPYYYANDTYYTQTDGGYVVAQPPQGDVSQTPPATDDSTESKIFIPVEARLKSSKPTIVMNATNGRQARRIMIRRIFPGYLLIR